jgi:hypothetical protein
MDSLDPTGFEQRRLENRWLLLSHVSFHARVCPSHEVGCCEIYGK